MTDKRRAIPDPLSGTYSSLLLAWWHDPGYAAPDGTVVTHYRQLQWAVMGGVAAVNDLERIRACYARIASGERASFGTEERMCVCQTLPDDLEAIRSRGGDHGDPKVGLLAVQVDLRYAADYLLRAGARWSQTRQVFEAQGRLDAYEFYLRALDRGDLPSYWGTSPYPPGAMRGCSVPGCPECVLMRRWSRRYAWGLMAHVLGARGWCRWPNEVRRLEHADRQRWESGQEPAA